MEPRPHSHAAVASVLITCGFRTGILARAASVCLTALNGPYREQAAKMIAMRTKVCDRAIVSRREIATRVFNAERAGKIESDYARECSVKRGRKIARSASGLPREEGIPVTEREKMATEREREREREREERDSPVVPRPRSGERGIASASGSMLLDRVTHVFNARLTRS